MSDPGGCACCQGVKGVRPAYYMHEGAMSKALSLSSPAVYCLQAPWLFWRPEESHNMCIYTLIPYFFFCKVRTAMSHTLVPSRYNNSPVTHSF